MFFKGLSAASSKAVTVPTTPKSFPAKLVKFFKLFTPRTSIYGSRRPPPTFYSSFYTKSSAPSSQVVEPHTTVLSKVVTENLVQNTYPQVVANPLKRIRKKDAIRWCATSFGTLQTTEIDLEVIHDGNHEIVQDLARRALKEKIHSRWLSRQQIQISPNRVTRVCANATLPALKRYSTSHGPHLTSLLGMGTGNNGLSYGRPKDAPRNYYRVVAIPSAVKNDKALRRARHHRRHRKRVHLTPHRICKTSVPLHYHPIGPREGMPKPKLVTRDGRAAWGNGV